MLEQIQLATPLDADTLPDRLGLLSPVGLFLCDDRCVIDLHRRVATQAFRRPVAEKDHARLMTFYSRGRKEKNFEAGITKALEAILASPQFLFRLESAPNTMRSVMRSTWSASGRSESGRPSTDPALRRLSRTNTARRRPRRASMSRAAHRALRSPETPRSVRGGERSEAAVGSGAHQRGLAEAGFCGVVRRSGWDLPVSELPTEPIATPADA